MGRDQILGSIHDNPVDRSAGWDPDDDDHVHGWDRSAAAFGSIRATDAPYGDALISLASFRSPRFSADLHTADDTGTAALPPALVRKVLALSPASRQRLVVLDTDVIDAALEYAPDEPLQDIDDYLGPWKTVAEVQELLHVDADTVAALTKAGELLGLPFEDGKSYYPARQFNADGPLPGLSVVIAAFRPTVHDPQTIALWMAGSPEFNDEEPNTDLTMWDLLAAGEVDEVLRLADDDTANWGA